MHETTCRLPKSKSTTVNAKCHLCVVNMLHDIPSYLLFSALCERFGSHAVAPFFVRTLAMARLIFAFIESTLSLYITKLNCKLIVMHKWMVEIDHGIKKGDTHKCNEIWNKNYFSGRMVRDTVFSKVVANYQICDIVEQTRAISRTFNLGNLMCLSMRKKLKAIQPRHVLQCSRSHN